VALWDFPWYPTRCCGLTRPPVPMPS